VSHPHVRDGPELGRLAEAQAALRRVATLVARAAPAAEVFEAVTGEVGRLIPADAAALGRYESDDSLTMIGFWSRTDGYVPSGTRHALERGTLARLVLETRRPGRIDTYAGAGGSLAAATRDMVWRSSVGAPVIVEGRLWGLVGVGSTTDRSLPLDTEARLAEFTELLTSAIANAQSHEELTRLAEEQAALRRVATLVAQGTRPVSLFAVVAEQVARVLHLPFVSIVRYEADATATECASFSDQGELFPAGTRWSLDGTNVVAQVRESGRPARIDDYSGLPGVIAETVRRVGIRSTVGIPIVVAGRLWGTMVASSAELEPLPEGTETRLADFTELVATAISNSEARAEVHRLADDQAALRRVATLVAEAVPAHELLAAVAAEAGMLLEVDATRIARFEGDQEVVELGGWSKPGYDPPSFDRAKLEGTSVAAEVRRTGRVARIDDHDDIEARASFPRGLELRSVVGAPIVVEGRRWGVMVAWSTRETLPSDAGPRLMDFTELVATAVANAEARAEVGRLAEEQAALRRVATLVARAVPPAEVFAAVAEEVGRVLHTDLTIVSRLDQDGMVTVVARAGEATDETIAVGSRWTVDPAMTLAPVLETGRPARVDDFSQASGETGDAIHRLGLRSAVATPVVIEGHLWGAIVASSRRESLPADTERRMAEFTELVATAIANAESRAELTASRTRLVTASDDTRRRFERDLHDGVQQRLVTLSLELRAAEAMIPPGYDELEGQLARMGKGLISVLDDLRELSRGIHPAILSEGGLGPALKALARRSAVPIKLDVDVDERLAESVEVAAYYIVSEALANATKHSRASVTEIHVEARHGILDLRIHDDGVGGADPSRGYGLTGLTDRVEALGGTIAIASPAGEGTSLHVELPVEVELAGYAPPDQRAT
jgi:signal transduction histidine kinase